jgi:Ca-activated chloride channel family protein
MTFGSPTWLWALLTLPALAFFFAHAEQTGAEKLRKFVAARLLPELAGTVNRGRRIFRFVLLLLVLALVIISLAQPRWGYAYDEVKRKGLDLLLAVDVSRSMLSNDVQPNRLERVKLATQDLINELQGDRAGLIAFAGRAFLQAPLTIDYDAVVDSINDLDTTIIPEGGTNISDAIGLAVRTFGKSATGNRGIIIFTDGEELRGDAVQAAKAAADAGIRIFTIGVGTPGGSLIPIQSDNGGTAFVKDPEGQVVKSKLDEARLREIAQAANGFYLHLENGPRTMKQLINDGLSKMQQADINARLSRRPIERYEWPLSAAIALFALALLINDRRNPLVRTAQQEQKSSPFGQGNGGRTPAPQVAAIILLGLVAIASSAHAASRGIELYQHQKYPEAYDHFEQTLKENPGSRQRDRIQFDAGAAAYNMKDYNKALEAFSQALLSKNPHLQAESNYNLGNTLYQRGEAEKSDARKLTNWESALQHYQETLKIDPHNQRAKDNYEYVKKKIDELKNKKEQQQQQPSPSPTPPQKDKQKKQDQKQKQQDQQNQDQQQQQKDQQQKDQKDQKDQQQQQQQQQQNQNQQDQKDQQQAQNQQSQDKSGDNKDPKEQQQKDQSQAKNEPQKKQQQSPGESPSPSPGAEKQQENQPSPSPGQSQANQPSPSPGQSQAEQSPSPGEGENEKPSPSPGEGEEENASPTPAESPQKKLAGEVKGAGGDKSQKPADKNDQIAAEAEQEKEGQMSERQALALLESMKDEEARVRLDERKVKRHVYNDW